MDIILGIRVQDCVILATSKAVTRGISVLKDSDDKTRSLSPHCLMGFTGEAGDTVNFSEYIQANVQLYTTREGVELSPQATASFVRQELAKSIRSRKPYQANVLIAGYDTSSNIPELYQIDYLGTKVALPYAAHGYAGFYTFSLLDRHYRPDMTKEEGLSLLQQCVNELQKRMPVDFKGVLVKVVSKDGISIVQE
ncbi:similar to Saccharomyces cerevisiae YER012W PRE1 Beta 4 subunit of the 20S proteasome [Maudiozyma saulgeensis]|uniref:Proteasome subunit beta n=1 Tax=Maudiozyma saulgeensis TaxID=1789683 RepID=A0A1X7QXG3_9SACH|nr:similar to Saccharomyces cerevisiae YER012W PRE1 Beta 4 subunit of the 20S proteasome [Kazachstania saulgeensis]